MLIYCSPASQSLICCSLASLFSADSDSTLPHLTCRTACLCLIVWAARQAQFQILLLPIFLLPVSMTNVSLWLAGLFLLISMLNLSVWHSLALCCLLQAFTLWNLQLPIFFSLSAKSVESSALWCLSHSFSALKPEFSLFHCLRQLTHKWTLKWKPSAF